MIRIDKLWDILKDRNVNTTKLRTDGVVIGQSHTNLVKMLKGRMACENLTLKTINSLCNYLDCQPGDILEFVPDEVQHKAGIRPLGPDEEYLPEAPEE